ncbi:MAG: hypothetical protein ACJZ80_01745 [Candidatus Puniceispirillales bacterium]|jgi:hypothetical protein|tara:strand:- start:1260 stop:1460 length:201 start_codon:yes stop_codon:yes gene_type:complete
MKNENYKLDKLKAEQKAKSKKNDLFDSYVKNSRNIEDKIALIKLRRTDNSLLFVESLKTLMKDKIK